MLITKSDFLKYQECDAYFWFHKKNPSVLRNKENDAFVQKLIDQGAEVEQYVRKTFPGGKLVKSFKSNAVTETKDLLDGGQTTIFQATFSDGNISAMVDVLQWNPLYEGWDIYEVKSSSSQQFGLANISDTHLDDATFQKVLLDNISMKVINVYLVELNKLYTRRGDLNLDELFVTHEITTEVQENEDRIRLEIDQARQLLDEQTEPGRCDCQYKSRKNQCPAFDYFYPNVPGYSVYDIARIGSSLRKLRSLVDEEILELDRVRHDHDLTIIQKNQCYTYTMDEAIIRRDDIRNELNKLVYPLYFLDYETLPSAIPKFDLTSPFQQVPFQYSLHIQNQKGSTIQHKEFLHDTDETPVQMIAQRLREDIGDEGSIIVWSKRFETTINKELAESNPGLSEFLLSINTRVFDLMEIFSKQLYVHKDFKGKTSLKAVLPVLCPKLSYDNLNVRDGGMACSHWERMIFDDIGSEEKSQIRKDLLVYCELDTWAMVKILEKLHSIA